LHYLETVVKPMIIIQRDDGTSVQVCAITVAIAHAALAVQKLKEKGKIESRYTANVVHFQEIIDVAREAGLPEPNEEELDLALKAMEIQGLTGKVIISAIADPETHENEN